MNVLICAKIIFLPSSSPAQDELLLIVFLEVLIVLVMLLILPDIQLDDRELSDFEFA